MARLSYLPTLLIVLGMGSISMSCFCDHYAWSAWSICSRTCNHGTQARYRSIHYDEYYWKNNCQEMCQREETRACNVLACPINCQLTAYGPYSECSPCAQKKFQTRSLLTPAQFGGQQCSETLTEEMPCYAATECRIEPMKCGNQFKCHNGRCIDPILKCNYQNDCGDNSDEEACEEEEKKKVCRRAFPVIPGSALMGNGFDPMAEEMRGAVLDNMFMGDTCRFNKSYRIPGNIESFELKVENLEDLKEESEPIHTEIVHLAQSSFGTDSNRGSNGLLILPIPFLLFGNSKWFTGTTSFKTAVKASQVKDSKFFRVHQVVAVSKFKTKKSDLYLSAPFLKFLNSLPLEYNYALYSQIFKEFGTHYFSSGTLGGLYDLLYQYDREELNNSGFTDEEIKGCLNAESFFVSIIYNTGSKVRRCQNDKIHEEYKGSMLKMSEKSISLVRGGRTEYAAALAWEKKGTSPDTKTYKDWVKSTIDNPTIVEYELLPIIQLVQGIPCAATKRRHLERAMLEYLEGFDSCKCSPCPNNARPVLSGTECLCVCQTGTYGSNCEKRAPDYTSEAVDGHWSCWGAWSSCHSSLKKHRTRECNNPAPLRGGQPCQGLPQQEETCVISIFKEQNVCINDNDHKPVGEEEGLPPGIKGCPKPKFPANSHLRINKRYYDFGDHEEFLCFTGYELEGYQFINCLPDGTWSEATGACLKKVCRRPALPEDLTLDPMKEEYSVGTGVALYCSDKGMKPSGPQYYTCGPSQTWEPSLATDIHCVPERPFVPDSLCKRGEKRVGSTCVCVPRDECRGFREDLCILDANIGAAMMMSLCAFYSARCHGDKLFFMNKGPCQADNVSLDWAKFRASMSKRSTIQDTCGLDTCYEWETCFESERCECIPPRDCGKEGAHIFCVKMLRTQTKQSRNVCLVSAMKCARLPFEILHEGSCDDR